MQEMPRKIFFHRVLNRGRRTESRLLFGSFCRSKKNVKTSPFRELSIAWKACPCRGGTLRVPLLPFSLKHGRLAHIRSQFSLFRRSPTHKNLPLAIFCTSEQGVSRFCKPRISAHKWRYRTGQLNSCRFAENINDT